MGKARIRPARVERTKAKKRVKQPNSRRPLEECREGVPNKATKSKAVPFGVFVGVDQTGAVMDGKGRVAKPLKVVVAKIQKDGSWYFVTQRKGRALLLDQFDKKNIEKLLRDLNCFVSWNEIALVIDCVLGLPKEIYQHQKESSLWDWIYQASDFQLKGKDFGREVAEAFFKTFQMGRSNSIAKRECEVWSQSNSVFQVRPYQKNIQTGTFRFWKELGRSKTAWAHVWPFDSLDRREVKECPWIFEGYPSLIWKNMLGCQKREPGLLKTQMNQLSLSFKVDTWGHVLRSSDQADALVLAFGGVWLQEQGKLWCPFEGFETAIGNQKEGWILGLSKKKT